MGRRAANKQDPAKAVFGRRLKKTSVRVPQETSEKVHRFKPFIPSLEQKLNVVPSQAVAAGWLIKQGLLFAESNRLRLKTEDDESADRAAVPGLVFGEVLPTDDEATTRQMGIHIDVPTWSSVKKRAELLEISVAEIVPLLIDVAIDNAHVPTAEAATAT